MPAAPVAAAHRKVFDSSVSTAGKSAFSPWIPTQAASLFWYKKAGLDPTAAAEMYSIVQKLNDRDGITVVMISHDISAALQYASHILHIGETTFFGTKAAYQAEFPPIWRKEGEVQ